MQLVKEIEPAINQAKCQKGDEIENVIINNVINVTNELKNSQPLLNSQIKEGKVKIIGAVYDIETGKVEIISK
jgi:carbonic anhydrase